MTELVTFGETPLRFSPPANERLELAREANIYADGMSSNVAIAANELGAETTWLSKLPNTPLGRRVQNQVQEHGVETVIPWTDDETVRQGLLFRESGSPPRDSHQYHDRGDTAFASATPDDYPMELLQNADVAFTDLSSSVLSDIAAETSQALLRAASGGDAVTALDMNYAPGLAGESSYRTSFEALAPDVDVLFANEDAVRTVLDRDGQPRELANVIASAFEMDIVVITRAERGAVTLHDSPGTNVIHERETIDSEAVDPTGQHGAFIGAFLEELIRGSDAARALSYAVASAVLMRTVTGPHLTTVEGELEPLVDEVIERSQ